MFLFPLLSDRAELNYELFSHVSQYTVTVLY